MSNLSPFSDLLSVFVTPAELREAADKFDAYLAKMGDTEPPLTRGVSVGLPLTADRRIYFMLCLDIDRATPSQEES